MANLLKNFELQKVIGGTSPNVLQEYFHSKGLLKDIEDFLKFKKKEKADNYKRSITDRILEMGEEAGCIISDFKKMFTLTRERAFYNLLNRIEHIEKDRYLLEDVDRLSLKKEYDILFYFLSKEPSFIRESYLVYSLNSHTESYWNRRHSNIQTRTKDITKEELRHLELAIKDELKKVTRGEHCQIQHVLFDGKDHLFVLAEDMPTTIPLWHRGSHADILIRPSFDLAFVYDRHEGELDICCVKGGSNFRNKMQLAFSKAVLGKEIAELKEDDEIYDLPYILQQLLDNKKVDFCTSTGKNISDIFIRIIRLKGRHFRNGQIILDIGKNERISSVQDDIYSELEDFIKVNHASPNKVDIHDLELCIVECIVLYYDEVTGKQSKKKFSISGSSGCNLGFEGIDKEIRECLKEARIQLSRGDSEKQEAA